MLFKKYKTYKKNLEKDYLLLEEQYEKLCVAEDNLKEMVISNNKIFIIKAENEDEFNKKYNNFMAEISEGIKQGKYTFNKNKLGSIFIINKSKIKFSEHHYIINIEYEEVELKKIYTNKDYLEAKQLLEKLEKDFKASESVFNSKYIVTFYEKYMKNVRKFNFYSRCSAR